MAEFISQAAFEIGRRLELRGLDAESWLIVIGPAEREPEALDTFLLELGATIDHPVRVIQIEDQSTSKISQTLREPAADTVILTGFGVFTPAIWREWDLGRSRLERPGAIILWLTSATLSEFCANAPNIRGFVGGSIFRLSQSGSAMTDSEISERIRELESHYQMSSDQMIERAAKGELSAEPQIAEWLILLGRGDLI